MEPDGAIMLNRIGAAATAALGMGHAPHDPGTQKCIKRKYHVRNKLIAVLLVSVTAGAASAQVADSFAIDTSSFRSDPAATHVAISPGSLTNSVLADPDINEHGTFDLGPMFGEPLVPSRELWSSDLMAVDGGAGASFVDLDAIQAQREVLFRKLDLLLRADIRSSPVYFGVDREVKFVEHHDYQPGIPVPVGISYRKGQERLAFFGELAPILDPASPTSMTSMGWGGGIGIRFYFGR
jgi:hypothetical protein